MLVDHFQLSLSLRPSPPSGGTLTTLDLAGEETTVVEGNERRARPEQRSARNRRKSLLRTAIFEPEANDCS